MEGGTGEASDQVASERAGGQASIGEGERVAEGQELAVIEAMKMEYVIRADAACTDGVVHKVAVKQGGVVNASDVLFVMDTSHKQDASTGSSSPTATVNPTEDPSIARPELQELQTRRHFLADAGRATSVAKRHARGYRTVRENLSMLLDPDSFLEYGDLALAAQKQRYTPTDLISKTGGDGIVTCFGRVDGHTIGLIMGDYMVLAGTQGYFHHLKLDRILTACYRTLRRWCCTLRVEVAGRAIRIIPSGPGCRRRALR